MLQPGGQTPTYIAIRVGLPIFELRAEYVIVRFVVRDTQSHVIHLFQMKCLIKVAGNCFSFHSYWIIVIFPLRIYIFHFKNKTVKHFISNSFTLINHRYN